MQAIHRKHLCFKHPFTCTIAGPTSTGKTVLMRNILKNNDKTVYFKNSHPNPLKVLWSYGQWQDLYTQKINNCEIEYIDGLPSQYEIENFKPHLIVIDDLMSELSKNVKLINLFTKGSHHLNISVILISQNLFL